MSEAGAVLTATRQRRATLKLSTNIFTPLRTHISPSGWACSAMAVGISLGSRSITAQVITISPGAHCREQLALLVRGARLGNGQRRSHRAVERYWGQHAAQLLHHETQVGERKPLTAVFLGYGKSQPPPNPPSASRGQEGNRFRPVPFRGRGQLRPQLPRTRERRFSGAVLLRRVECPLSFL